MGQGIGTTVVGLSSTFAPRTGLAFDASGATTAQINSWLAASTPLGVKRLVGTHTSTEPIQLPSNTWVDASSATVIRGFNTTGNAGGTFINADQTNGNTNITISGVTVDVESGVRTGKHFSFVGVDGLAVTGTVIKGVSGDFMALYKNCTGTNTSGARWVGGTTLGEDGLHLYGGRGHVVSNCHITSGDDALSLTTEAADNDPLEDVQVSNCVLSSSFASGIKIHAKTKIIRRVNISNVSINHAVYGAGHHAIRLVDELGDNSDDGVRDVKISRVSIDMASDAGYAIRAQGVDQLTLDDIDVRNLNNVALYVSGGVGATAPIVRDFTCDRLRMHDQAKASTYHAHLDHLSGFTLTRLVSKGATAHAIVVGGSAACTNGLVSNCHVEGGAQSGIRVTTSSTYVKVVNNRVTTCANAITESGSADNNTFEGNDTRGCTSSVISKAGASSVVRRNRGYVTEAQGADTLADGQSSKTVTHGLGATPTVAFAVPKGSAPDALSTTMGAGTIVVYRSGTTGALDFSWRAEV